MRKPLGISLLFLSLLTGCDDEQTYKQDFYQNKEDCVKDWNTADNCTQGSHPSHGGGFYGPHYYYYGNGGNYASGHSPGTVYVPSGSAFARGGDHSIATGTVRGGFGSSGHAFGGGISG